MLWKIAEVCMLIVLILAVVAVGVLLVTTCISVIHDFVKIMKEE